MKNRFSICNICEMRIGHWCSQHLSILLHWLLKNKLPTRDKMIVITNEYLCLKCYLNFCEIVLDEIGSF